MVPAFNMLGRGNRLHGEGFGMMQNLVDPNAGWGYALQCSPSVRAGGKVFGGLPILPHKTGEYKATYSRRRLTENGLSSIDLESRFYAVLSKAAASSLASNPRRSKSREPKRPKVAKVFERAESIEMAFLRLVRYQMNEFTAKNEQAFLDACGAIGVEPNAMIEPHKERYLVSEFLKDPVSWLETELLYYSYTTSGEAQEVANGIDRMISAPNSVHRVLIGA
jgi:hypothetical protein